MNKAYEWNEQENTQFYKKYPTAIDFLKSFSDVMKKPRKNYYYLKSSWFTTKSFEDTLKFCRSDIRKWFNRWEILEKEILDYQILFNWEMDDLEKKVKKWSEYRIVEHLDKKFIAELCRDKIKSNEEPERFKKVFDKYCKNDIELLSDDDINYARNIPMAELLEWMTDIKIKRKASNCPFCEGQSDMKFHCKDNLFQCFKCWKKWDSIWFYMLLTGSNFIQTVKELRKF